MTDDVAARLNGQIDRIVNRVRAGSRRKAVMREEMLAHLLATYEKEVGRRAGEDAFDAAVARFGDEAQLEKELQASVPTLERCLVACLGKERLMWRLLLLCGLLAVLFGTGMVLPALAHFKQSGNVHADPLLGLAIGTAIVVSGLHWMGWGIVRRLRKTA